MPKKSHTELNCSPDGSWLTIRDGERSAIYNVRDLLRARMCEAGTGSDKRVIGAWLKAREAKGKRESLKDPPKGSERRPASATHSGIIPASRLIPAPKAKPNQGASSSFTRPMRRLPHQTSTIGKASDHCSNLEASDSA